MWKYELKISKKDWIGICFLSLLFSIINTMIIYILLGLPLKDGLISGFVLGIFLGTLSFFFVHISNKYLILKFKNIKIWYLISAITSVSAGFIGFYFAFLNLNFLGIVLPKVLYESIYLIGLLVGILNYVVGLLLFLFINMRNKKELIFREILELKNISNLKMVESHFLSNLLNSIIELMYKDLQKAENVIISLAKFLRSILREEDLIILKRELEIVKTYVKLQNIRYKEFINFSYIIKDETILYQLIPKFTILFLVENAIKHGFKGNELFILLKVEQIDSHVILYLENNGNPIERFLYGKGLDLISKRLKLLVNGRLILKSKNPVCFQIIIPKKLKEKF